MCHRSRRGRALAQHRGRFPPTAPPSSTWHCPDRVRRTRWSGCPATRTETRRRRSPRSPARSCRRARGPTAANACPLPATNASWRPSGEIARRRAGRLLLGFLIDTPGGARMAVRRLEPPRVWARTPPLSPRATRGSPPARPIRAAVPSRGAGTVAPDGSGLASASSSSSRASPMSRSARRGSFCEAALEQTRESRAGVVGRQRDPVAALRAARRRACRTRRRRSNAGCPVSIS